MVLGFSARLSAGGHHGSLLDFQAHGLELGCAYTELGIQQGRRCSVVQLSVRYAFGYIGGDLAECVGEVYTYQRQGAGQQQAVPGAICLRFAVVRVGLHVFETAVQVGQHIGELVPSHDVGGSWRIEPLGHGLEIEIVAQVLLHVVCEGGDARLILYQPLALCLEGGRLGVDLLEGGSQGREGAEGGGGVGDDLVEVGAGEVQLLLVELVLIMTGVEQLVVDLVVPGQRV